jgi:cell division topological specificity factor
MTLLSFFSRPRSAPVARERLQLLLAHERTASRGRIFCSFFGPRSCRSSKHVVVDSE